MYLRNFGTLPQHTTPTHTDLDLKHHRSESLKSPCTPSIIREVQATTTSLKHSYLAFVILFVFDSTLYISYS
jgi:hypothetical protein